MIKAIIIDDEQHCIDRLSSLLNEFCKQTVLILGTFKSVDEGRKAIERIQPELVFLDIQIGKETGFDLLQRLPTINFNLIFTTAFDQYAVKAFKFSAIDYLLKPVDPDELIQAVDKCKSNEMTTGISNKFEALFHNLKNVGDSSKKISVPTLHGYEIFNVSDIIRCQSDVNYTTIYLINNHKLMVAKTLKEFEEMLSAYKFFRVHNSHLVNLNYIKSYNKGKGGYLTLTDNSEIEVSTRRKDDFLKELAKL